MGTVVFISYATIDSEKYQIARLAKELAQYPEIANVLYWEEHMHDDIFKYMNDNLKNCDILLLFCSPGAVHSESVEMEWMSALKMRKKVIPIFENTEDIPPLLTTKLGVCFDSKDLAQTVGSIHQLILKKTQAPSSPPPVQPSSSKLQVASQEQNTQLESLKLEELTEQVAQAIFGNHKEVKIGNYQYWVKKYKKSGVRYVEISPYRFLEQNPSKSSVYAKMAKEGKKVLWVLQKGTYHGRWIEGEFVYMGR